MSTTASPVNYWPENKCAKAFWTQREIPAYKRLLRDTAAWLNPLPGDRWIDLGCGSGQLTKTLWEKSGGQVAEIVALDVAAANAAVIDKLRSQVEPPATQDDIHFLCADFSHGLARYPEATFDGATSGLAIQYAESWDEKRQCWTDEAYGRLLADVRRVLRPGGHFVFSVNVPNPSWWTVAATGVTSFITARKPLVFLKNSFRMMRYGAWLKQEARRGRFHYLPWKTLSPMLEKAGFDQIEHKVSFVRQAYVVRCRRPI